MRCRNCGNTDCFVLVLELTVLARGRLHFSEPDWGLSLECGWCASTDVHGDPVAVLSTRLA